jgi:hypothetical protein
MNEYLLFIGNILTSHFASVLFGGLVTGIISFYFHRRAEFRKRNQEIKDVLGSLYWEIRNLRHELSEVGRLVSKKYFVHGVYGNSPFDAHFFESIKLPAPSQYKLHAGKLGFLDPIFGEAIYNFYDNFEKTCRWLPELEEKKGRPFSYDVRYVLEPLRDAVVDIEPTLRRIEDMLKINTPAKRPDLGKTEAAISHEADMSDAA